MHKSGFVNIIGQPNVGKSTLMNSLLGEKMSIITSKPQTTRHRILGIYNDDDHQVVFSDTPGLIEDPSYGMHQSMNRFAYSSFEDADVLLFVLDLFEDYEGDECNTSKKYHTLAKLLLMNTRSLRRMENHLPTSMGRSLYREKHRRVSLSGRRAHRLRN